mgnify:CR=1 FL=1
MFDKLEDLIHHYEELMNLLSEPDVANDANRFKKLMKEQSDLAPIVETYKKYKECKQNIEDSLAILDEESDEEMRELAKEELKDSKEQVEELEKELKILLLPKDPNDDKNVIVEIRAGAGGEEAALFAAEIYRMYVHYAENRGWKVETLDADETGIGGMKSVEFMVKGSGAYSILKYESGVHRVQRVPETESQGRIQTSTCSVAVMPEAEDVDVKIDDKDIRIDVMRASGNGGQCVNTTDSAVRLTHYPTGIVIYSQTEKSQIQNKEKAFALLRTKLYDMELQKKQDAEAEERRSQIGTGDRAEKIRTYNFPQGRVTDHRIKLTLYKIDAIMDGDIQELIDSLIADAEKYDLDGLNLDFESLKTEAGVHYIEFIRELSIPCRQKGIVLSVDNYVPARYNSFYNLKEQGIVADYVIMMGYDEHFAGGEPGSVSSISYVKNGISGMLEDVPKEKLINAVPFYTRLWIEAGDGSITSKAMGIADAKKWVDNNQVELTWQADTAQYYGEKQTNDGAQFLWMEEERSLKEKMNVVRQNDLAGVACWKLGFEDSAAWDSIQWN